MVGRQIQIASTSSLIGGFGVSGFSKDQPDQLVSASPMTKVSAANTLETETVTIQRP